MSAEHRRIRVGDQSLHVMLNGPEGGDFGRGRPTVVFSHGFTVPGFESNRMFWRISQTLSSRGWQCVLFDYRGSGYSDMQFEDMTIQTEQDDLHHVLTYVRELLGAGSLYVWGMSLGTSVAAEVLASGEHDVRGLVLWGLSAELYERWSTRWQDQFDKQGYAILPSGFIVRPSVVEGMNGIDTYASLRRIHCPILCVAGGAESSGEARMSRIAKSQSGENFVYVEYEQGVHGFKGQPDLFQRAVDESVSWLEATDRSA